MTAEMTEEELEEFLKREFSRFIGGFDPDQEEVKAVYDATFHLVTVIGYRNTGIVLQAVYETLSMSFKDKTTLKQ